mgnify:CR=1 FL=1|jgi:N-acetylglucosamine-6-phosphate deacetylase
MRQAFINGKIYTGHSVETNRAILVDGEMIVDLVDSSAVPSQFDTIDLKGYNIAPALIDMQIYGAGNKLFSADLSVESLQATYEYCVKGGCSHFMITMATNAMEKYSIAFDCVREYWKQGGKGLLGVHLEGPYINPSKRGAHLADYVKKPTVQEVAQLLEKGKGVFKMMTLAPERCDDDVIDLLLKNNILLSAGHSDATYEQAIKAFDKGIPLATHLYNAMSGLHHREVGMVGAIFSHPKVMCSLVADGIHVSYPAIRIAKQIMQDRLFLITDTVTESEGEYIHKFTGDRYALPDGTLSGSALTMMQGVSNMIHHANVPLDEALRMASTYPAKLLTGKKLGKIKKGYEARFVIFDNALNIQQVYC